ncbi:SRPBCC family protein [Phenylobacterium immobile]|uniref:SRPBCC family protein n=1 Tax=Phenylobacterium immobile TaxID=21 RepID=UPI000A636395|nr:SRPBCC domain-containing protein [Phenylobacterium immobile]
MSDATLQAAVVVERTYQAPADDLWALWTTKAGFESWWGPEGFRVEVHVLEAREGGALDYDMIADAPEAIAAMESMNQPLSHGTHGVYTVFEPTARLSLMHIIDFIPGVAPYDSIIDVAFIPAGDETHMVVTLHPHLDPHWTKMSIEGFNSQLAKLDRRLGWAAARRPS